MNLRNLRSRTSTFKEQMYIFHDFFESVKWIELIWIIFLFLNGLMITLSILLVKIHQSNSRARLLRQWRNASTGYKSEYNWIPNVGGYARDKYRIYVTQYNPYATISHLCLPVSHVRFTTANNLLLLKWLSSKYMSNKIVIEFNNVEFVFKIIWRSNNCFTDFCWF